MADTGNVSRKCRYLLAVDAEYGLGNYIKSVNLTGFRKYRTATPINRKNDEH